MPNPHARQHLLTKRLLLGLQSNSNNTTGRKRPYASLSAASNSQVGQSNDEPIDIISTWREISNIFPLLSYGDESKELMLALMGNVKENANDEQLLLNGVGDVSRDMLRVKRHEDEFGLKMPVGKKQKVDHSAAKVVNGTINRDDEILPWNVVLRVVVRFTAFAARQIHVCDGKSLSFGNGSFDRAKSGVDAAGGGGAASSSPHRPLHESGAFKRIDEASSPADSTKRQSTDSPKPNAVQSSLQTNTYTININNMSFNEIRTQLKRRDLDTTGKLPVLRKRLQQAMMDIDSLNLNEIRSEIRQRNLDARGSRSDLIRRLKQSVDPTFVTTSDTETLDVGSLSCEEIKRELANLNLDCRGNRDVLVKRLKGAVADANVKEEVSTITPEEVVSNSEDKFGLNEMSFNEIRSELNKHGLECKGKKHVLLERLRQHFEGQCNEFCDECEMRNDASKESDNNIDGDMTGDVGANRIHPIVQSLDIVVSELNIMLRTEKRRREEEQQQQQRIIKKEATTIQSGPINSVQGNDTQQPLSLSQQLPIDSRFPIVRDRMMYDWKNKSWSGPSRHALLKDVEFIISNLDLKAMGISANEFQEKMDTIVGYLDEYAGFENSDIFAKALNSSHIGRYAASPMSSPFLRLPMSSPSRPTCLSLAEMTRVHINHAIEMQKEAKRKRMASPKKDRVDNQRVKEPLIAPIEATESMEDDDDDIVRIKDAYRMALAFAEGSESESCSLIKRRLDLLAQTLNDPKGKKHEIAGADSYLRLLLRELLSPSDPALWSRLINESQGKETTMLLRKGRAVLVSFLIELKVPGWDDEHELEPSPLADYLGFLSARRYALETNERQHAIFARSSFLLPDNDVKALPPPPVVTEIGLGSCVANFVEQEPAASSAGIDFVFSRKAEYPCQTDTNVESIEIGLPDVCELTRDLFDLTLRFAATNDDREHANKPFPLRLATMSSSESIKIVLNAVSDNCQWLQSRSVSGRCKRIMETIIDSFGDFGCDRLLMANEDLDSSWGLRASFLIKFAETVQNRARVAMYATQFMLILCDSSRPRQISGTVSLYNRLQLQRFQFRDDLERDSAGNSSIGMSRMLDWSFCTRNLLPLAHHCSTSLASGSQFSPVTDESTLHLITILCSVFRLIHDDALLANNVHVGWAIEVLSISIGFFIQCEKLSSTRSQPSCMMDSKWHQVYNQLKSLYDDAWGSSQLDFKKFPSFNSSKHISFTCIDTGHPRICSRLMPSFEGLVTSLVDFVCPKESLEFNKDWVRFVSSCLLGRYASVLPLNSVALSWIRSLVSILCNRIIRHKILEYSKTSTKRSDEEEDAATQRVLRKWMNPLLKSLHCTVVNQHATEMNPLPTRTTSNTSLAFTFSELYRKESKKILIKPSHFKTRKWHVYRDCLEKVFVSTPPAALFGTLTESSTDSLREVCHYFGQSHLGFIMVSAGLAVNESLKSIRRNDEQIRTICDAFTLQSKECISQYFAPASSEPSEKFAREFTEFANGVGRQLQALVAESGLMWWDEVTSGLSFACVLSSPSVTVETVTSNTKRRRDIHMTSVLSCLEERLSAISHKE